MSSLISYGGSWSGGSLRIAVVIFALLHTLFRGIELLLDLFSTVAMMYPLFSGNSNAFQQYLNAESKRVLWKGPYNDNFTFGIGMEDGRTTNSTDPLSNATQLKINLHLWSTHLLMQCLIFVFGWILIFSGRRKNYNGCLAWLSFSTPVFLQSLLHFVLDFSFWDYLSRPLQIQIFQGLDIVFQPIGLILVACFLHQLYNKNDELQRIDRYNEQNGFPRNSGNVTIRQIVDDNQRF